MLVATAHGNALANLIKNPTLCDLVGGIESVTLGDEEARRRRSQKTVLERAAEPTFPLAVEMHSRHQWAIHEDVGRTVDLLLRGQNPRPQQRELLEDGQVRLVMPEPSEIRPPQRRPTLAVVPMPDPRQGRSSTPSEPLGADLDAETVASEAVETEPGAASANDLQVLCCGLSRQRLEEAVRCHGWPVQAVDDLADADVLLSVRQGLGRQPALRRQAREAGVPILVIKSDSLPQVERALDRLLSRRSSANSDQASPSSTASSDRRDALAALEECRLAVEQVVMAEGRPVELLPRSEAVLQMQADLVSRYSLRSDVYGPSDQRRLRVFPP